MDQRHYQPPLPLLPQPPPLADGRAGIRRTGRANADIIFVMERAHRTRLQKRFRKNLKHACLDIPDDDASMQPELVALLEKRAGPHLR